MTAALFAIIPLVVIAAAVFLLVMHFSQKEKNLFNFNSILLAYCYVVALISLIAVVVGGASVGGALLSDAFGRDFTYESYNQYYDQDIHLNEAEGTQAADIQKESIEQLNQQEKDRIERQYQDDLFNGSSVLVVGLIFLAAHIYGWRSLEKRGKQPALLSRAYIFSQLAIYGVATLIALPTALSQLLRFLVQPANSEASVAAPGTAIAVTLLVLPIWIFFTVKTVRTANRSA